MIAPSETAGVAGRPLAGLRVLVGRAAHQASELSAALRAQGADVIEIPFIEIREAKSYKPFDNALHGIAQYDWLVLTSVNGVEALAERMKRTRVSAREFKHLKIAAIGPATRSQIEELGLKVEVMPKLYVAEAVVESLREKVKNKRVLLARAKVARDIIPQELRRLGASVDVVEAYETVVPESSRRELKRVMHDTATRPQVVTFTSSSTVRNFVELLREGASPPQMLMDNIRLASIGPVTSSTLRQLGLPVHIEAREYTIPGLVQAICSATICP